MQRLIAWLFGLFLVSALAPGCAVQKAPEGGPPDTQPPRLDSSAYSTPSPSTNFRYEEVILTFNEWVKLNDAYNQVVVSPLMKEKPEVKIKRRSVVLRFKSPLRNDLTYTIDFGQSVQDITQGNTATNLRVVLSAGPTLDSAQVSGAVADAGGGELPDNLLALLYEGGAARSVRDTTPLYLAKVDKQGLFRLQNLRADTFRLVVLADQNLNYRFDLANERIAFVDTALVLSRTTPDIRLRLFAEEQPIGFTSATAPQFGKIFLNLNQSPENLPDLRTEPPGAIAYAFLAGDKAVLWYRDTLDSVRVFLPGTDTISVPLPSKSAWLANSPKLLPGDPASTESSAPKAGRGEAGTNKKNLAAPPFAPATLLINEPLRTAFNHPLQSADTARMRLSADSGKIAQPPFRALVDSTGQLRLETRWPKPGKYRLTLMPQAVTDILGLQNLDTLRQEITVLDTSELSSAEAQCSGLDSTKTYFIELLDQAKKTLQRTNLPLGKTATWRISGLKPGTFYFRLVRDDNGNGRWDTGNYDAGRQPEPLFFTKGVTVRKNFEAIMEIQMGNPAGKAAAGRK